MLQNLGDKVRLCYLKAEDFARRAKAAPTETLRADYLRHEQSWLQLARSYELQQRLTLFVNEKRTRKAEGYRGMGHISPDGLAVGMPGFRTTDDDPARFQNKTIAIVDDEDCVRDGLSTLIESRGRRAATFASAEDYLSLEANKSASCLILDVHLPGMSGPDLQAHLIAIGCCPPTIFVSGRFEEHVRKRVIGAGALGYLGKPCDEQALFDCIERAFGAIA